MEWVASGKYGLLKGSMKVWNVLITWILVDIFRSTCYNKMDYKYVEIL